jgi:serine/threonine protein kinase
VFQRASAVETMSAILNEEPPPLTARGAPASALDGIVRRCLEKDPNKRYQSAKDIAFALGEVERYPGIAGSQAAPARRRRVWIAAGLAAAAGIVLLTLDPWRDSRPMAPGARCRRDRFHRGAAARQSLGPLG